ncbi:hypothetical protein SAMN02745163_00020 [Clostridium cavendishii DSM 21758]|uniref:Uncharacterized protein n=1 Tax=Clostridium cavendishii DSM 21758 TaxID=1121302 RepID=A0A1M6A8Z8_9CLOT|nr:hypothetical protein [Clostridium cavendishii]SHI33004.1 hypothetical protein SAMN02745163_00020 [Clostridium cavendishii DSM 21758]
MIRKNFTEACSSIKYIYPFALIPLLIDLFYFLIYKLYFKFDFIPSNLNLNFKITTFTIPPSINDFIDFFPNLNIILENIKFYPNKTIIFEILLIYIIQSFLISGYLSSLYHAYSYKTIFTYFFKYGFKNWHLFFIYSLPQIIISLLILNNSQFLNVALVLSGLFYVIFSLSTYSFVVDDLTFFEGLRKACYTLFSNIKTFLKLAIFLALILIIPNFLLLALLQHNDTFNITFSLILSSLILVIINLTILKTYISVNSKSLEE